MKDEEFEKYFRDITNCMYDCTITKAERRTQIREILEEIYQKGYDEGYTPPRIEGGWPRG